MCSRSGRRRRFEPALRDGKAIAVEALLATNFTFRTSPQVQDDLEFARFFHGRDHFEAAEAALARALATVQREVASCSGATPVGGVAPGRIREPVKIKDVRPVYPSFLLSARRSALIVLAAVIDRQGVTCHREVLLQLTGQ